MMKSRWILDLLKVAHIRFSDRLDERGKEREEKKRGKNKRGKGETKRIRTSEKMTKDIRREYITSLASKTRRSTRTKLQRRQKTFFHVLASTFSQPLNPTNLNFFTV
jgi:hypothetical protein